MAHTDDKKPAAPMPPTTLPKTYKLRGDGSFLIPMAVLAFLGWSPGDEVRMTVDVAQGQMVLTQDGQPHKAIDENRPGASIPGSDVSTQTR